MTTDTASKLSAVFDEMSRKIAGGERMPLGERAQSYTFGLPEVSEGLNAKERQLFEGLPDQAGMAADLDESQQTSLGFTLTENRRGSLAWGGYANGRIPEEALEPLTIGGHMLERKAAFAFHAMMAAAAADGVKIKLSSSYRDYDAQVSIRKRKGHKVATAKPGTSTHGWGRAIDVSGAAAQRWIQLNGSRFGWVWPDWAQRKGTKQYEPWHFEFRGSVSGAPLPVGRDVMQPQRQQGPRSDFQEGGARQRLGLAGGAYGQGVGTVPLPVGSSNPDESDWLGLESRHGVGRGERENL